MALVGGRLRGNCRRALQIHGCAPCGIYFYHVVMENCADTKCQAAGSPLMSARHGRSHRRGADPRIFYFPVMAAGDFWECTVFFNRHYVRSGNFGLSDFWFYLKSFWLAWWILFLLSGAVFLRPAARIWFWACLFGGAWLCSGASVYGHYYILLMPFWAVLAANGIKTAGELLASLLKRPPRGSSASWPPSRCFFVCS